MEEIGDKKMSYFARINVLTLTQLHQNWPK